MMGNAVECDVQQSVWCESQYDGRVALVAIGWESMDRIRDSCIMDVPKVIDGAR